MNDSGEHEDMRQEEAARAAQARPDGEPVALAGLLESLAAARAAWERRRLAVIESDCPPCTVDSAAARVCGFRGHEFCHHSEELKRRARLSVQSINMRGANVPGELHNQVLRGCNPCSSIAAARRIVAGEGKLAIFAGGVGGGKSLGIAYAIAERGGFFCEASALDPFGKEANDLLAHCSRVALLGVDDAGAGRSTSDVARGRLEQLVCQRWDAGRPTIVSTNLARAEFWPLYGGHLGRMADRLSSDPVGWVACLEASHRKECA